MTRWLLLILLFSFLARLYRLNQLTLFGDEIDVGNQAYSLLTTLRDYRGHLLPSYIQSFSEWRAPLSIYATIPSIALFGRTELSVRLPSVIFGTLSIYLFYLLTRSHLGALLLSLTPWHFHYSRTAFEVTLLLCLYLLATYLYLQKKFLLSVIFFALTLYTYSTANIFTPILIILLLFLSRPRPKSLVVPFFVGLILVTPLIRQLTLGRLGNRFGLISIFNDPKTITQIIDSRTSFSAVSASTERLFHNKLIAYSNVFFTNYLQSFSPNFLFLTGDPNPRHSLPGFGLLPLVFLPFLILGLQFTDYRLQITKLFLFWLLVSPIPSALTLDGGHHATRLFLILPPLVFFTAQGLRKRPIFLIFLIPGLVLFFHQYFVHYPKDNFESWNYGQKHLFSTSPPNPNRVFVSNTNFDSLNPYIFYQHLDPRLTQNPLFSDTGQNGFYLDPNTYLVNDWQNPDVINQVIKMAQPNDVFFLLQLKDIPGDWNLTQNPLPGFKTLNTVYLPNQQIFGQVIQKI